MIRQLLYTCRYKSRRIKINYNKIIKSSNLSSSLEQNHIPESKKYYKRYTYTIINISQFA